MTNAFVQISPDSSGKRIQTFENVIGGQTVEATAICNVDATGVPISTTNPFPAFNMLGVDARAQRINSTFYQSGRVLRVGGATLISIQGHTSATTDQFLQFFDSATIPADGAVPIWFVPIPANTFFALDIPVTGVPFTAGITVSNSTTSTTKTAGGNNCWFMAVIATPLGLSGS